MFLSWCRHWLRLRPQRCKPSRRSRPGKRSGEALYLPSLELLESRNLLSSVFWDTLDNPNGGSWNSDGSWFNEQHMHTVPRSFDDVTIDGLIPGAVVTVSSSAAAGSLNYSGPGNTLAVVSGGLLCGRPMIDADIVILGGTSYFDTTTFHSHVTLAGGALGGGTITNIGDIFITGAGPMALGIQSLINNGTITQTGTGDLLHQGVLENNMMYDLQVGARNYGDPIINTGTFRKSGGGDLATVENLFDNMGGAIAVSSGTLRFSNVRSWTGAALAVTSGNHLLLNSTGQGGAILSGAFAGAGAGEVRLESNTFIIGEAGASFSSPPGMLQWTGGALVARGSTTLTNLGTITLSGADAKDLRVKLVNSLGSTIVQADLGALTIAGELDNEGTYDLQSDAGISFGGGLFVNTGEFRKSGGPGTSSLASTFASRDGTLIVSSGTLSL
jgi:hypothetical protein